MLLVFSEDCFLMRNRHPFGLWQIRNYQQLKLRFQFFASALQYVLIADESYTGYRWGTQNYAT